MKFIAAASTRFVAGALCLTVSASCAKKEEAKPKGKPPVPVGLVKVETKDIPVQVKAIGTVEPFATVTIKSQINGEISRVHFTEGKDVRKGEVLFTIDPRQVAASLKQAEANLAKNVAQARNAQEQAGRYAGLVKEGIVTQEQYDQLRTNAEALSASANADRAAVENARVQLSYCTLRSPIDGRTGNLLVHQGNVVRANDTSGLVVINQIAPIYVSFTVPERELSAIKAKVASGKVGVDALLTEDPLNPERGVVGFLDNAVDPSTGTIRIKGTFPNAKKRLWPGRFVNVVMTLDTLKGAVTVPTQALLTGQQGQYVWIVRQDTSVEQRQVVPGITSGGSTVILKGLAPGETVVIDGQMRLFPGAKALLGKPGQGQGAQQKPMGK